MKKNYALTVFALLCFAAFGQDPDEWKIELNGKTYPEICTELDARFATEYHPEGDCPDNEWVKYQRWKWFWRDRVQPDGTLPDLKAQWLDYSKAQAALAQQRNSQPSWDHEGPTQITGGGGYWGMGRTIHVAFHPTNPNVFYVGTPDGGI